MKKTDSILDYSYNNLIISREKVLGLYSFVFEPNKNNRFNNLSTMRVKVTHRSIKRSIHIQSIPQMDGPSFGKRRSRNHRRHNLYNYCRFQR
jgi:hypothetical protein